MKALLAPVMALFGALFAPLLGRRKPEAPPSSPLDYDEWIHIDAEDLAEQGMLAAYLALRPELERHAGAPLEMTEEVSDDGATYAVLAGGRRHEIWSLTLDPRDGWERATVAFFDIVNASLDAAPVKFYAINGGNDLGGMFLTPAQCEAARKALPRRADWPWLPVMEPPHYGFPAG